MSYRPHIYPGLSMGQRPGRLVVAGHSYTTGTGATDPTGALKNSYGWHSILRDALGGPSFLDFGINGAVSFRKPNGFPSVLQGITSVRTTGTASAMPNAGVYAMMIGLNDLSSFVGGIIDDAAGFRTWETAIMNYLLRPLQSVVIEDSDAGWTYTGAGWGASVPTTSYSGTSIRAVTSHTALTSCSYVIPSWFDGDHVHLALIGANAAPNSVAIKVNGTTVTTVDLSNRGNNTLDTTQDISYPIRIAATAGQTVLAEVAAGGGNGGFLKNDYLALEATPRPLVLFAGIARLATYASFWANITDSMVNNFNAQTRSIISALNIPEIVFVDVDAVLNKQASCFYTDNTHPSTRGHSLIAQAFLNAALKAPVDHSSVVGGGNTSLALVNGQDTGIADIGFGPHGLLLVSPNTGTTLDTLGAAVTTVGTIAHPTATTTLGYRATLANAAATANTGAAIASTNAQWTRGDQVNIFCGLFYHCRFGLNDASYANTGASTGTRMFFGFSDQTEATMRAADNPAGNRVGLQYCNVNAARVQTTFNYNNKDGTTETLTDTLVTLTQNSVYDFYMFMKPNGGVIYYQLDNLTANTSLMTQIIASLPTNTVMMRPMFIIQTINAVVRTLAFYRMYTRIPNFAWPDTG